ncbi:MAG: Lycopene cyclase [Anaerolineae bacterium]|nr:Lycopene cyclase [Anaerolineae bacterium]
MKLYDFIIAGGGVAGLSLAYHLSHSPLRDSSILIVDKNNGCQNDLTLSFWTNQATLFDDIVYRSWDQLRFVGDNLAKTINLGHYRYQMIRGSDFYRFVRQELSAYPKIEFLPGTIQRIEGGDEEAKVWVDGQIYRGQWVFDSRFKWSDLTFDSTRYHYLKLHFKGWEIVSPEPVFEPQVATLLDFRTPQQDAPRFFYVLPFSERRALVEYTLFSRKTVSQSECEHALRDYIGTSLGIKQYRILQQEGGLIPVTDQPFPRQMGPRIMTIGTPGGRVKPSTGYAFWRIQQDSANIVKSLGQAGHPLAIPPDPAWYGLCDSLMLHVMQGHGEQIKPIFTALFKNNPIERVFHFLDEAASAWEYLALIASLPPRLFLQALGQTKIWGRIFERPNLSDLAAKWRWGLAVTESRLSTPNEGIAPEV